MQEYLEKEKKHRTTLELTQKQYFYLLKKVMEMKKHNPKASIGSVIRQMIQNDMSREERVVE